MSQFDWLQAIDDAACKHGADWVDDDEDVGLLLFAKFCEKNGLTLQQWKQFLDKEAASDARIVDDDSDFDDLDDDELL